MKTRFIAAALVLVSLWGVSAPLVLAATARQTATSRTHTCCWGGHIAFGLPISAVSSSTAAPCGGQHPCCAKQAPAKAALAALNQENRPGLESAPVQTIDGAPNARIGIAVTPAGLSHSSLLRSTVLRI
jgi:hypothetical protein